MAVALEEIAPEPITDAREFLRRGRQTFNLGEQYLPDVGRVEIDVEDPSGALDALRRQLTAEGNEAFRKELAEAFVDYFVTEDFRYILAVLSPWFRTMALKSEPEYEKAADWARSTPVEEVAAQAKDVEEVIAELSLEDSA